ncbi:hypothetical protein GG344DRAFT_56024 [Lentinula edodes]|nr:hypothetical protein GG344DRAFT_56024 [Lentinula edodes]
MIVKLLRSTRNNRIERLWVEVGAQFARKWRAFFQRLESLHGLDIQNNAHLWLLHHLFLDEINEDCKQFCSDWNSHPISGMGHDQSPEDMRLLGRIEHGEYHDDCEGLDPAIIDKYYGIDNEGSEIEDDLQDSAESDSGSDSGADLEGIVQQWLFPQITLRIYSMSTTERITEDIRSQFHHAPVRVPKHENPFASEIQLNTFNECLVSCLEENIIPSGFGVLGEEWGDEGYPSFEILKSGRRGTRELRIPLPVDEWLPRAELWVQALVLMDSLLEIDTD